MKLPIIISSCLSIVGLCACSSVHADNDDGIEAFEYRDVYLPDYNKKANHDLNLNFIDSDWGLWGHNLKDVLPDNPSLQAYAKRNGSSDSDQFCFTSNKLYDYIVDYIKGNFIFADSIRFAILPNDNDIVCQCIDCVRIGNTKDDASPAVFYMIKRLADKFPKHQFYTSYYSSTKSLPDDVLPPNVGVIVSAIDYTLSASETNEELAFMTLLNQWSEKTDKVYIWDYINNFDDYFTPAPIFSIMQRRLKLYRDSGVNGVFLNGSGNDYSTFAKLKKTVLAQLLQNPDFDWEELLRKSALEYYPEAGNDIADFIILQEKMIQNNGKSLPMYEGVEKARKIYLPEKEFVDFYNKIIRHKKIASGEEKEELELMADAMALTMLELKRINRSLEGVDKLKERLGRLKDNDIHYYNEGAWSIEEYLSDYSFMEKDAIDTESSNLLKGVKLKSITPLDEDYTDISIVTDGFLGIPSNYHNGNLITSADPKFSISIPRQDNMKSIKVWMVYNPGFRIGLPEEVYITSGGYTSVHKVPERMQGSEHSFLEFDVPPGDEDITLTLVKNPEIRTMAIDEIQAF